ncbi:hypothetical protein [Micromonospora sp. RV43]|uniref:hypothetical protein n=1 Tax=Micromonospora sp. RV43 TaxID=1661387 RepID=UPI00064C15B9|nr:hypothetical protein [Micromonospora sp. RV43]
MLFTATHKIDAKVGDVIEVTAATDGQTYQLRIGVLDTIDRFPVVTGRMVDGRGRTTDEIRTVVLDDSNPYVTVPGRRTFAEIALWRLRTRQDA